MKRQVKLLVDIAMYVLLLYLMNYQAGRGLLLHGVLGCIVFGLFLLHHLLNLGWYRGLKRGTYTAARIVFLVLNFLLSVTIVLMAVSSVMMSGNIFAFSPVPATEWGRALHTASTAWGFILMSFHVGLHTHVPLSKYQKVRETFFAYAYILLFLLVMAAGIGCCLWSGLWGDMFLRSGEAATVQPSVFYGQLIGTTIAASQAVHLLLGACSRHNKREDF